MSTHPAIKFTAISSTSVYAPSSAVSFRTSDAQLSSSAETIDVEWVKKTLRRCIISVAQQYTCAVELEDSQSWTLSLWVATESDNMATNVDDQRLPAHIRPHLQHIQDSFINSLLQRDWSFDSTKTCEYFDAVSFIVRPKAVQANHDDLVVSLIDILGSTGNTDTSTAPSSGHHSPEPDDTTVVGDISIAASIGLGSPSTNLKPVSISPFHIGPDVIGDVSERAEAAYTDPNDTLLFGEFAQCLFIDSPLSASPTTPTAVLLPVSPILLAREKSPQIDDDRVSSLSPVIEMSDSLIIPFAVQVSSPSTLEPDVEGSALPIDEVKAEASLCNTELDVLRTNQPSISQISLDQDVDDLLCLRSILGDQDHSDHKDDTFGLPVALAEVSQDTDDHHSSYAHRTGALELVAQSTYDGAFRRFSDIADVEPTRGYSECDAFSHFKILALSVVVVVAFSGVSILMLCDGVYRAAKERLRLSNLALE